MMDLDLTPESEGLSMSGGSRPPLTVLRATPEELAENERVLAEIAKESKGKCVWKKLGIETA